MYPSFAYSSSPPRGLSGARALAGAVAVDREALRWVLGRVARDEAARRGLGVSFDSVVDPIVDGLIRKLGPTVGDWAQRLAAEAEPKVRQIAREEIAPRLGMYAAFAMLGAGIFSGLVGAFFASRGYKSVAR